MNNEYLSLESQELELRQLLKLSSECEVISLIHVNFLLMNESQLFVRSNSTMKQEAR